MTNILKGLNELAAYLAEAGNKAEVVIRLPYKTYQTLEAEIADKYWSDGRNSRKGVAIIYGTGRGFELRIEHTGEDL